MTRLSCFAAFQRGPAALAVGLCCCLWLLGCPRLLGIDERKVDSQEYPPGGYPGCVAQDCSACLFAAHRLSCERGAPPIGVVRSDAGGAGGGSFLDSGVPGVCAQLSELDPCTGCACGACQPVAQECMEDPECRPIWGCLSATACSGVAAPGQGCLADSACAGAIESGGGVEGAALGRALRVRQCATAAGCEACEPKPAVVPLPCKPGADCRLCESCTCDPAAGAQLCDASCPQCAPPVACETLGSCVERCQCRDKSEAECAKECPSLCVKGVAGTKGHCGGCDSCLARCTCQGTPAAECAEQCSFRTCQDIGDCACGACLCSARDVGACIDQNVACHASECTGCACSECPVEVLLCTHSTGCFEAFECLQCASGDPDSCHQKSCPMLQMADHSADAGVVMNSPYAALEALLACTASAECNCPAAP